MGPLFWEFEGIDVVHMDRSTDGQPSSPFLERWGESVRPDTLFCLDEGFLSGRWDGTTGTERFHKIFVVFVIFPLLDSRPRRTTSTTVPCSADRSRISQTACRVVFPCLAPFFPFSFRVLVLNYQHPHLDPTLGGKVALPVTEFPSFAGSTGCEISKG